MKIASFQANLMSIHANKLKYRPDSQTAFQLYIYGYK